MAKAGDFLVDEGGVYLAFNSTDGVVKKRTLKLASDPLAVYGLIRTGTEAVLTGSETCISRNTAVATLLNGIMEGGGGVFVNTPSELLLALSKAKAGDIIYIQKSMTLDSTIVIPDGVVVTTSVSMIGDTTMMDIYLKNTPDGENFRLGAGSTIRGFRFIPKEPLATVVATYNAFDRAVVSHCEFAGEFYDYASYYGSIVCAVSNNVSNKLSIKGCVFTDCYTPIQHNGDELVLKDNTQWNSGAVFSSPVLPTIEDTVVGVVGAKPASNADFISNETITVDAIKSFCDTNASKFVNMGIRINGEAYTPNSESIETV